MNLQAVYSIYAIDLHEAKIPSDIQISVTDQHPGLSNVPRNLCEILPELQTEFQTVTAICGIGGIDGQHVMVGVVHGSAGNKVVYYNFIQVFGVYVRKPGKFYW